MEDRRSKEDILESLRDGETEPDRDAVHDGIMCSLEATPFAVEERHPQIQALVCTLLSIPDACDHLIKTPPHNLAPLLSRIAKTESISGTLLRRLERLLNTKFIENELNTRVSCGGIDRAAQLLEALPNQSAWAILEQLSEEEPEMGIELDRRVLCFENMDSLREGILRKVFSKINPTDLGTALAGYEGGASGVLLRALPESRFPKIMKVIRNTEPAMRGPIDCARDRVVRKVRKMIAGKGIERL